MNAFIIFLSDLDRNTKHFSWNNKLFITLHLFFSHFLGFTVCNVVVHHLRKNFKWFLLVVQLLNWSKLHLRINVAWKHWSSSETVPWNKKPQIVLEIFFLLLPFIMLVGKFNLNHDKLIVIWRINRIEL